MSTERHRPIRSYVRRSGRMTRAQQRALDELWEVYGVDHGKRSLDLAGTFGREATTILEIGFGNGDNLAELALRHPENNYLGVEVHEPGVGHLFLRLERDHIDNVRVVCHDAVEVLEHQVSEASLDGILIFFPDPWPKKRHHKRRLIQPGFIELLVSRLKPGGLLHLATDWESYAEHMLDVLNDCAGLRNAASGGGYAARPESRPMTRFERRGRRLGHRTRDLLFRRTLADSRQE